MISVEFFQSLGLFGLFAATLLSATFLPAVGIPLIAFLLYKEQSAVSIIVVATLGNWIGAIAGYYLGYYCKWEWIEKYLRIKPRHLDKINPWIQKYHSGSALMTGFPVIGDRLTIALGLFKTEKSSTFFYFFLGKLLRYVVLVGIIMAGFISIK